MKKVWESQSVEETGYIAKEIFGMLKADSANAIVLTLVGDLGAGKTTFTQWLARELGIEETIISPTFVIAKFYDTTRTQEQLGFKQLIHIDAYRLEESDEIKVLGFEKMLAQPNTLIVVEWPEHIADILPNDRVNISIKHGMGDLREFVIE